MKISEIRQEYYEASGKVSDLVRQLDLAGIAVIWIFKVGTESGGIKFFDAMFWPLGLFVISLGCDLLQYVYKSALLGLMNHCFWCKYHDNDKEVKYRKEWNWPTLAFFWLKIVSVIVAYVMLLKFIFSQL